MAKIHHGTSGVASRQVTGSIVTGLMDVAIPAAAGSAQGEPRVGAGDPGGGSATLGTMEHPVHDASFPLWFA